MNCPDTDSWKYRRDSIVHRSTSSPDCTNRHLADSSNWDCTGYSSCTEEYTVHLNSSSPKSLSVRSNGSPYRVTGTCALLTIGVGRTLASRVALGSTLSVRIDV